MTFLTLSNACMRRPRFHLFDIVASRIFAIATPATFVVVHKLPIRAMSESMNAGKAAFYPHEGPTTTAEERAAAGRFD